MESVISIGVLAVAVPMILAAMGESGRSGEASGAETRAPWIAAACFDELRAASLGRSQFFTADEEGRVNPPENGTWALAFTHGGAMVNLISPEQYASGVRESGGRAIRFIARVHPAALYEDVLLQDDELPTMRVTIEYPSAAPAERRRTVDFHAYIR